MTFGIISIEPHPCKRGGPYDSQFSFRCDGEEFQDSNLTLYGVVHLHFPGPKDIKKIPSTSQRESESDSL